MTQLNPQFVLCIDNSGYPASLVPRKVYRTLPDDEAVNQDLVRVIDESGDDYLYPADRFVNVELSEEAQRGFSRAG